MVSDHLPAGMVQLDMRIATSWPRRVLTEPLLPVPVLALIALLAAAADTPSLCWAALAALAGYSLSGSV